MSIALEALSGGRRLLGREAVLRGARFAPPPRMRLSQWADRFRKLTSESAAIAGQWVSFPFQKGIMDSLWGDYRRVVAMLPSQICGKTEIALNLLLAHVHLDPCSMLFVTYSLDMARRLSRKRIAPAFREMRPLKGKIAESNGRRESDDTLLYKAGPGWSLALAGANSPGGLAMDAVRVLVLDEVDRFPPSAGEEGDVISLAEKRTTSYPNRIVLVLSTPTLEGTSRIANEYQKSNQSTWRVPCPHCNAMQSLEWGGPNERFGLKWEKGSDGRPIPDSVQYCCLECACLIEERWKHQMNEAGLWVPAYPERDIAGFQATCLVSPIYKWSEAVIEWYEAKGDPEQTKAFVNTRLCRTYSPPGEQLDTSNLSARRVTLAEDGAGFPTVPNDAGLLTMGVDVQQDRLEAQVSAWGAGDREWKLGVWRIPGSPLKPETWQHLETLRTRTWKHEAGASLTIRVTAVDSSAFTSAVCDYVRPLEFSGVMAIKGASDITAQPITRPKKRSDKHKVLVWILGTVALKDTLFGRLQRVSQVGPGYIQFSQFIDDTFLEQLGAERAVTVRKGTQLFRNYERIGKRANEGTDLSVMNLGALYSLGMIVRAHIARRVTQLQRVNAEPVAPAEKKPQELPSIILGPGRPMPRPPKYGAPSWRSW